MVLVYKWGGIAFDDKSLIKSLFLPTLVTTTPVSFHDEDDNNYQVPGGKVFIPGKLAYAFAYVTVPNRLSIGESDSVDAALTKLLIEIPYGGTPAEGQDFIDVIGIFVAGKYVTAKGYVAADRVALEGTSLYGVEIDA